jgi:hypothetical protein
LSNVASARLPTWRHEEQPPIRKGISPDLASAVEHAHLLHWFDEMRRSTSIKRR